MLIHQFVLIRRTKANSAGQRHISETMRTRPSRCLQQSGGRGTRQMSNRSGPYSAKTVPHS